MKERPIIFSGPMVRAILEGRKTQTRRLIRLPDNVVEGPRYWSTPSGRPQSGYADPGVNYWTPSGNHIDPCPYGFPGDRLWVRESFQPLYAEGVTYSTAVYESGEGYAPRYVATEGRAEWHDHTTNELTDRITPAIYMPRWASRITLEVTGVRVERLQEITEADAKAEGGIYHDGRGIGHTGWRHDPDHGFVYDTAARSFAALWDSINEKRAPWASNPWVWVVEFRRLP